MRLVTMKPTSVIIMDTHPIIRMSIEVLLQKNSELQIVLKTYDYRITIDYLYFSLNSLLGGCNRSALMISRRNVSATADKTVIARRDCFGFLTLR